MFSSNFGSTISQSGAMHRQAAAIVLIGLGITVSANAQDYESHANFGGPDAVPNLLESTTERLDGALNTWDNWKAQLKEDSGFGLGVDYSMLYFNADKTVPGGDSEASSGMLRVYGNWDLTGKDSGNTGSFVWKFEHRHRYTDLAPSPLWAATELGYIGLVGAPFSDQGARATNFYWRQKLNSGRTTVLGGFLDVTDFVDLYGMISPWLHFTNLALGTGSATMDVPNDATFGAAFGTLLTDNVYLVGSLVDANSDPTKFWESVENFFSDKEYFSSLELGWTTKPERIYVDNYHITLWHKDARTNIDGTGATKPSGWGVNLSFAKFVDDRWMPFLRAGYSEDGDSLLSRSVSAGVGYRLRDNRDLLGVGFNWGEPNENQGAGTDSQYTGELFYRLQAGKRTRLTADLQYIRDPAANPTEDAIWVAGFRGVFSF